MNGGGKWELHLDSREPISIKQTMKQELIPHKVLKLNSADFAGFDLSTQKYFVGIERKRVGDLVQSIQTKRIFDQINRLRAEYPIVVIAVTGTWDEYIKDMKDMGLEINNNVINGAIASMLVHIGPGAHFLKVDDLKFSPWIGILCGKLAIPPESICMDSDTRLCHIAYKICEKTNEGKYNTDFRLTAKYETTWREILGRCPEISDNLALRLVMKYHTLSKVFSLTDTELQTIQGIGPEKAKKIGEFFHRSWA